MKKNKTSALYFASLVGALIVFFFSLFSFGGNVVYAAPPIEVVDISIQPDNDIEANVPWYSGTYSYWHLYQLPATTTTGNQLGQSFVFHGSVPSIQEFDTGGYVAIYPDGNYAVYICPPGEGVCPGGAVPGSFSAYDFFFAFDIESGTAVLPVPPIEPEGIVIETPVDSFIYANNPIVFSGTYTNSQYSEIVISLENTSVNQSLVPIVIPLPPLSGVDQPFSVNRNLPFSGAYTIQGRLWDPANATGTAWTSPISFVLGTTATTSTTTQSNLPGSPTPLDCSTFDIGCYIKNALVWAFWPSPESVDQYSSITLRNSFPFSYGYEAVDLINLLANPEENASTTVSATIEGFGTITFLSKPMLEAIPLASTVKTVIGYLCWIMMVMYVYRVVVSAFDNRTHA